MKEMRMHDENSPDIQKWGHMAKGTFWDYVGCEVVEINDKYVVVSLDILPHHLNLIGILHGGVHATLIDSTMGFIAMLARPEHSVVTVNLNLNYVAPIEKGKVLVTAEIVHASRKLITTQAFARREDGELLALGTGTFRVLDKKATV